MARPWEFELELTKAGDGKNWQLQGHWQRGDVSEPLDKPLMLLPSNLLVLRIELRGRIPRVLSRGQRCSSKPARY